MSDLFVTRIKARKEMLGLTMPEIAKRANAKLPTIEQYFYNQALPNFRQLVGLCIALECSIDYLAGLSDHPRSHMVQNPDATLREAYIAVETDLRTYQRNLMDIQSHNMATLVAETRGNLRTLAVRHS